MVESRDTAEKSARAIKLKSQDSLKLDDKTLRQLEDLVGDGALDSFNGRDVIARTEKLASKLVDYMTEEMEFRLNRIYVEVLHGESDRLSRQDGNVEEEAALKDELDSLYSEIRVLAEMAVQQEFKLPILEAVQSKGRHLNDVSVNRLDYVCPKN